MNKSISGRRRSISFMRSRIKDLCVTFKRAPAAKQVLKLVVDFVTLGLH